MTDLLGGLLSLHNMAAQRDDGLRPELLQLALRDRHHAASGAVPLPTTARSSGPAPDVMTRTELQDQGVAVLHPDSDARTSPDARTV